MATFFAILLPSIVLIALVIIARLKAKGIVKDNNKRRSWLLWILAALALISLCIMYGMDMFQWVRLLSIFLAVFLVSVILNILQWESKNSAYIWIMGITIGSVVWACDKILLTMQLRSAFAFILALISLISILYREYLKKVSTADSKQDVS